MTESEERPESEGQTPSEEEEEQTGTDDNGGDEESEGAKEGEVPVEGGSGMPLEPPTHEEA